MKAGGMLHPNPCLAPLTHNNPDMQYKDLNPEPCAVAAAAAPGDKGASEAGGMLRLTLKSLQPPEAARQQVRKTRQTLFLQFLLLSVYTVWVSSVQGLWCHHKINHMAVCNQTSQSQGCFLPGTPSYCNLLQHDFTVHLRTLMIFPMCTGR